MCLDVDEERSARLAALSMARGKSEQHVQKGWCGLRIVLGSQMNMPQFHILDSATLASQLSFPQLSMHGAFWGRGSQTPKHVWPVIRNAALSERPHPPLPPSKEGKAEVGECPWLFKVSPWTRGAQRPDSASKTRNRPHFSAPCAWMSCSPRAGRAWRRRVRSGLFFGWNDPELNHPTGCLQHDFEVNPDFHLLKYIYYFPLLVL